MTAIALIGEVLAWVGLIGAIVPLGIGMLIRLIDGGWMPVDLILDDRTAHWMVEGRGFSRELDDHEVARAAAGVPPTQPVTGHPRCSSSHTARQRARS